jgi:calcineurin-like phosphoesterase family protein
MDKVIFSHIPVHPDSKGRFRANIHGHLHNRVVEKPDQYIGNGTKPDPWYFCACVERTDYRPIALEEIYKQLTFQGL